MRKRYLIYYTKKKKFKILSVYMKATSREEARYLFNLEFNESQILEVHKAYDSVDTQEINPFDDLDFDIEIAEDPSREETYEYRDASTRYYFASVDSSSSATRS